MKIISSSEAARLIKDGDVVGIGGFATYCAPDELLNGIRNRFLASHKPENLKVITGVCSGDNTTALQGMNLLGEEGLIDVLIAAHFRNAATIASLVNSDKIAAYLLPLGAIMNIFRNTAARNEGFLSKIGLGTYVNPNVEGCAINNKAKELNYYSILPMSGENSDELLFYPSLPLNVCLIRGTYADEDGNICTLHEGIQESLIDYALAAHNNGGTVIVQVEKVVKRGVIKPLEVRLHGNVVDYVVVGSPENHRQTFVNDYYSPELTGEISVPINAIQSMDLDIRKIIARRAAMLLKKNFVVNLGIGIPSGIGNVVAEEGFSEELTFSMETGQLGGVPVQGVGFGGCINPEALYTVSDTFTYYDGGGLDMAFLGMGEVDKMGNVNVSKLGGNAVGPGGFIDIMQNTPVICFVGQFTTGGAKYSINHQLKVLQEGKIKKFVKKVEQISFSANYAKKKKQCVYYVTERAVFLLTNEGLELIEIAPGLDLQNDVLQQMEFTPIVSKDLKIMDRRIFSKDIMKIKSEIIEMSR